MLQENVFQITFTVAKSRLDNLMLRIEHDDLFDRYDQEVSKLLDAKYAEIVPQEEIMIVSAG